MIKKKLKPGKLVRFTGADAEFCIAGTDPLNDRNFYIIKNGMIGLHIRTFPHYEEILFNETVATMGEVYLETL